MTQPAEVRPFDMRLIQRGARLRRSPYFEATQRYGCRAYTVYNHMFLPSYYDDPAILGRDQRIPARSHPAAAEIPWGQQLCEAQRIRPRDLDLALHADVPERDVLEQVPILRHGIVIVAG